MKKQFKVLLVVIFVVVFMSALLLVLTSCSLLEGLFSSHTHEYTETVVDATCVDKGYTLKKCECGDEKKVNEIAALGHEYKDAYTIDKNATCTQEGSKSRHCKRCSDKIDVQSISALGHNYATTYTVDVRATCEVNGSESKHCSRCSSSIEPRPIVALGHDYAETKTTDRNATCTIDGLRSRHCSRCSSTIDAESIPRLGHNYSSTVTLDKQATCTEDGQKSCHCSRCDSKINIEILPKLGHDITTVITEEPTCTKEGYTQRNCSRCEGYRENIVPALGHKFEHGKCSVCSYTDENYYVVKKCVEEPYSWSIGSCRFEIPLDQKTVNLIAQAPNKELVIDIEFEMMYRGSKSALVPVYDGFRLDGEQPYFLTRLSGGEKYYCNSVAQISCNTKTYTKIKTSVKISTQMVVDNKLFLVITLPSTIQSPDWYIKNLTVGMGIE